ncbi:MAG: DUF1015 domain-containing protein [Lachnospiraceae bacterium]|nr:DUF1015 domain-containing protein [Lachnospiraceae bacterium]
MATIKPFYGIRPVKGKEAQIAALPYDVYNRQEAKEEVKDKPLSFLRIDRAETNFPDEVSTYDEKVYQKAHDLLWEMVEKGDFVKEDAPCYYIYELTMDGRTQTGIVACASIDDYENNVIKKHENTRADKEADRIHHVDSCNAQTGPIFLAYRNRREIDEVVKHVKTKEALYDFTSEDGIRHRAFVISDAKDIATIQNSFSDCNEIYIADGHHRAASAVKVGLKRRAENPGYTGEEEFNYFLSVLFPEQELKILDYNRVVKDLNGYEVSEFLMEVEKVADLLKVKDYSKDIVGSDSKKVVEKEALYPKKKGEFVMLLEDTWFLFRFKEELLSKDPVDGLDVALMQNLILEPILGINDPKTDQRIDFVGGIRGYDELWERCHKDMKVAFGMFPTQIGELFAVADANRLMPPKSTWFEPKLRSGLFIHELD